MIPITRIDEYLAVISQDEDATGLPDQAVTRIDMYLSKIAGEAVAELPEPVTRIDRYLASIAGMDVVMDDPITRIDYYLAAVAGVYSGELPEPVTRIDHYLYQWASEPQGFLHTLTGSILHITDGLAKPAESLTVSFGPIQAGSGDPSPDNVRPISGRTELSVTRTGENLCNQSDKQMISCYTDDGTAQTRRGIVLRLPAGEYNLKVSRATDEGNGYIYGNVINADGSFSSFKYLVAGGSTTLPMSTTFTLTQGQYYAIFDQQASSDSAVDKLAYYNLMVSLATADYTPYTGETKTISLPSTIYGGSDEVVGGNGSETWGIIDLGSLSWSRITSYANPLFTASVSGMKNGATCVCDSLKCYKNVNFGFLADLSVDTVPSNLLLYIRYDAIEDKDSFKTAMDGVYLAYELKDPVPFSTTPTQIDILDGENVIWSSGDTNTLEYWGSEADDPQILSNLNVLLGGRYYNNHTENEPTDAEALNILLGGNR